MLKFNNADWEIMFENRKLPNAALSQLIELESSAKGELSSILELHHDGYTVYELCKKKRKEFQQKLNDAFLNNNINLPPTQEEPLIVKVSSTGEDEVTSILVLSSVTEVEDVFSNFEQTSVTGEDDEPSAFEQPSVTEVEDMSLIFEQPSITGQGGASSIPVLHTVKVVNHGRIDNLLFRDKIHELFDMLLNEEQLNSLLAINSSIASPGSIIDLDRLMDDISIYFTGMRIPTINDTEDNKKRFKNRVVNSKNHFLLYINLD
ncbi:hypothetical protein [Pedobacter gandavensis]|uniref:Uncharacterized protein n=1 Tax=Pedobacter gandavensis TaxID=2679963 RepID=A0ABR6EUL6_9SPHI|nr:hypothetical protein [Pedobacter gandavensis]MBB2148965.1 hypothetical protein [Pedobacter gandavensis]